MKFIYISIIVLISKNICAQSNHALNFNGTNTRVSIGSPVSSGSSYTKEVWVYQTNSVGDRNILSSQQTPLWIEDGVLKAGQAGNYRYVTDPSAFPQNRWVHTAVTFDEATKTMRLYRDGLLISTATSVPSYTTESTFIGSHNGAQNYFHGNMDEVRIWNRALSREEIVLNLLKGPAPNATGLISYYRFNEGAGTVLGNSGANGTGSDGTIISGSWVGSPIQVASNAMSLDGINDYIDLGSSTALKPTIQLTHEIWARSSNWVVPSQQQITSCFESGGYGFTLNGGNINFFLRASSGSGYIGVSYPQTNLVNNNWYHLAGTFDGRFIRFYIDGNLVGTNDLGSSGNTIVYNYPNNRLLIGGEATTTSGTDGMHFAGQVDEARIWNVARTQADIQSYSSREIDPNDPAQSTGLVGYYTFNQGITTGTNTNLLTVYDQKGINHATLYGFALTGTTSNYVNQQSALITLPVLWKSFDARRSQNNVILRWETAQEQQAEKFVIQHSANGGNWSNLAIQPASGNSFADKSYSYLHYNAGAGTHLYRLQLVDSDGKMSYSEQRKVLIERDTKQLVLHHNIVANGQLKLTLNKPAAILIITTDGKTLLREHLNPGTQSLNLSNLSKGIYWLTTSGFAEKIIIQ